MALKTLYAINEYLTFTLAEEQYAINVEKIQSALELPPIMEIPQTPNFLRGVINFRGNILPVVDLKQKFSLNRAQHSLDSAIIVAEIMTKDKPIMVGILVDAVKEVIEIPPAQIEQEPRLDTKLHTDFIYGMGKKEEKFFIVLDIDKMFTDREFQSAIQDQSFKWENSKILGKELMTAGLIRET